MPVDSGRSRLPIRPFQGTVNLAEKAATRQTEMQKDSRQMTSIPSREIRILGGGSSSTLGTGWGLKRPGVEGSFLQLHLCYAGVSRRECGEKSCFSSYLPPDC